MLQLWAIFDVWSISGCTGADGVATSGKSYSAEQQFSNVHANYLQMPQSLNFDAPPKPSPFFYNQNGTTFAGPSAQSTMYNQQPPPPGTQYFPNIGAGRGGGGHGIKIIHHFEIQIRMFPGCHSKTRVAHFHQTGLRPFRILYLQIY